MPRTFRTTRSWASTSSAKGSPRCASGTSPRTSCYPLLLHEPYVRLYPSQVVKQADLVLAMHWRSHAFTPEQKARNVDYYERRTTRDSSLSACTQAVMCADVGHLRTRPRLRLRGGPDRPARPAPQHRATACTWLLWRARGRPWSPGFGGLRDDEGILALDPHLPEGIDRLRFRLRWRDFRLTVDVGHDEVTYTLRRRAGCRP